MRNPFSLSPEGAVGAVLLAASAFTGPPAAPAGADLGPTTCPNGFVWCNTRASEPVICWPSTRQAGLARNGVTP
jgi:hypothetical protein